MQDRKQLLLVMISTFRYLLCAVFSAPRLRLLHLDWLVSPPRRIGLQAYSAVEHHVSRAESAGSNASQTGFFVRRYFSAPVSTCSYGKVLAYLIEQFC